MSDYFSAVSYVFLQLMPTECSVPSNPVVCKPAN